MKADLTRRSFDPLKHFRRVLMQQGRVQLDADWNEQSAILLHMVRKLAAALLPQGGGSGFAIAPLTTKTAVTDDFAIGAGDFWVGGILCELESTWVDVAIPDTTKNDIIVTAWTVDGAPFAVGQYVTVSGQTPATKSAQAKTVTVTARIASVSYTTNTLTLDVVLTDLAKATDNLRVRRLVTYKSQPGGLLDPKPLAAGSRYQIYLDVWERLITSLEDDSIREVALNGPDTAARTQVVWQLRTTELAKPTQSTDTAKPGGMIPLTPTCMSAQQLDDLLRPAGTGLLQARTKPAHESSDPCTISPESHYRGPENQLYRVEIHVGRPAGVDPAAKATFKWSRENGAVVFPILKVNPPGNGVTTVQLGSLGRDDRFGLQPGDFVEIQDDSTVLANSVAPLLQVGSVDRTNMMVTLTGPAPAAGKDTSLHPLLRRWDQKAGDKATGGLVIDAGAAQIVGDVWLDLEDGVQVLFPGAGLVSYRSGDYWLIPARVTTGDVIWPAETENTAGVITLHPVAKRPDGVEHHYAALAVIDITDKAPVVTPCSHLVSEGT